MRVLITGITGFVGSHLAEYALSKNVEVLGSIRWRSNTTNIDHIRQELTLVDCDLRDPTAVHSLISEKSPDYIFHLAAQSSVPTSLNAPNETLTTNIIGQLNILESLRAMKSTTKMHIAGSSDEYGMVYEHEIPINENNLLRPLSPYAVSKVAQDLLGYQYHKSYGLNIVRTRAFSHSGPRRGHVFAESDFARQIAQIEAGIKKPVIEVGNLEAQRDFSDVRDIVRAYWQALEKGDPGEVYNISSGKSRSIKEVLNMLLKMSQTEVSIEKKPGRLRPSDVALVVGDSAKFREKTGWKPLIPFEQTLKDLLNYWRNQIKIG